VSYEKAIRERRIRLGLADTSVAEKVGLTIDQYDDVEQHADEFLTNISMLCARRICAVLGFQLRALLLLPPQQPRKQPRSSIVKEAREAKGLSTLAVAELIGFEEHVIRSSEEKEEHLDFLPVGVIFELEKALGLEKGALVA
jgi:ribosome-binding protein aMBF1 (putative translation factor)